MAKVIIIFFKEILANSVCSAEEKKVMLAEFEECYNDSFVKWSAAIKSEAEKGRYNLMSNLLEQKIAGVDVYFLSNTEWNVKVLKTGQVPGTSESPDRLRTTKLHIAAELGLKWGMIFAWIEQGFAKPAGITLVGRPKAETFIGDVIHWIITFKKEFKANTAGLEEHFKHLKLELEAAWVTLKSSSFDWAQAEKDPKCKKQISYLSQLISKI